MDPLNRDNRIGLDKNGNRTSVTDGNGHTTNYRYDPAGRLRLVSLPELFVSVIPAVNVS